MSKDIYAQVSARIIAELEAGAAPWVKPWSATPGQNIPCNAITNRPYSGVNVCLLWMMASTYATPRFLTYKQAQELGGNVRKGEHGYAVVFVKPIYHKDDDDQIQTGAILKSYTVFNVDQCDGLPEKAFHVGQVKVRNSDERDATGDE